MTIREPTFSTETDVYSSASYQLHEQERRRLSRLATLWALRMDRIRRLDRLITLKLRPDNRLVRWFIPYRVRSFASWKLHLLHRFCFQKTQLIYERLDEIYKSFYKMLGFDFVPPSIVGGVSKHVGNRRATDSMSAQEDLAVLETPQEVDAIIDTVEGVVSRTEGGGIGQWSSLLIELEAKGYPVARMVSTLLRNSQ